MAKEKADVLRPDLPKSRQNEWSLVWNDEFDYEDSELDESWDATNSSSSSLYCSRWRENAVVTNGTLRLENRKEKRAGFNWTSASVWTKERFKYGYFECRYKYAAAKATNNSFWLMVKGNPESGKRFELDINEGHYPNEININVHNWSDNILGPEGLVRHDETGQNRYTPGTTPDVNITLDKPITAQKVRFSSVNGKSFTLKEFRAYAPNPKYGYPDEVLSYNSDISKRDLVNHIRNPKNIFTSSTDAKHPKAVLAIADGDIKDGWESPIWDEKWVEIDFTEPREIGNFQFITGDEKKGVLIDYVIDYKIEYYNGSDWITAAEADVRDTEYDLSKDFHTYALEWNEEELIFYMDGNEIHREPNVICHNPAPVILSEALLQWDGPLTDDADGTAMVVDYVRVWEKK